MKRSLSYLLIISFLLSCFMGLTGYSAKETDMLTPSVAEVSIAGDNTKGIIFTLGKDIYSYHFTWQAVSSEAEYIQYAENSSRTGEGMPASYKELKATVTSNDRGYTARVMIKGLKDDTEYCYRVGSDKATWSDVYTFKTSCEDGAFSFILSGDPQIGAGSNAADTENWNAALDNARDWFGDEIDFLMTAGDQVNSNTKHEQYKGFMSNSWMRSIPTVTTVGNHDDGINYSNYYTYSDVDSNTVTNGGIYAGDYWFPYDSALIMSLNFNNYSIATHKSFMQKAINDFNYYYGEPTWIIAVFHQPIYSQGTRAEYEFTIAQRNELAPVLSELGVDVVLTGHDHVYTRAYMMNGTTVKDDKSLYTPVYGDPYGSYYNPAEGDVFYLTVNSGSGSKYYNLNANTMPFTCVAGKEHVQTLTKVDVTWDSISFTTHRVSKTNTISDVYDFFAIHRETDYDFYPPTLTVPDETYMDTAEPFDAMAGVTAYDNVDGDISDNVTCTGEIDYDKEFILTYSITDRSGNTTQKTRKIIPYSYTEAISSEVAWKYIDDGSSPCTSSDYTSWTTSTYNDSSWKSGYSPFGAVLGKLSKHNSNRAKTLLNQYYPDGHANAGDNIPHFYFRTEFDLTNPELVRFIKGSVLYDDSCLVFINGIQIANLNASPVKNCSGYSGVSSTSGADLGEFVLDDPSFISTLNLKEKGNVLAVGIFQSSASSSDVFFKFGGIKFAKSAPEHYAFKEIVSSDVTWDFKDDGTTPYSGSDITSWATSSFDSSAWKKGVSPFGTLSGKLGSHNGITSKTLITHKYPTGHTNAGNTIPNYFFRHEFDLESPELVRVISGTFAFDDACEIYINGVKVAGYNAETIKNGAGYSGMLASFNGDAGEFTVCGELLRSLNLKEKGNVLAAILYQGDSSSSDALFAFNGLSAAWAEADPSLEADGVTLTMKGLKGAKDVFIAKGTHDTYRAVKDNLVVQLTQNKLQGESSYTYILKDPGEYTVYIRYDDKDPVILYRTITVTEPGFKENGLQIFINNLEGVKVIRTAYGEYKTAGEVKRAAGSRSFSSKNVTTDEYMIQYRESGRVTVAVVYENGYNAFYYYDVQRKEPTFTREGNKVIFGDLDDLKVVRYAKGEYTSSNQIKNAAGSVALTPKKIVDGFITVELKSAGTYTFCVQYNDESYNYYTVTV